MKMKKGIRHENGCFTGRLDRFLGSGRLEYSVQEILSGRRSEPKTMIVAGIHEMPVMGEDPYEVKRPTSPYEIGRYMALAQRLQEKGVERGDLDAATAGTRIYAWLGQGKRKMVMTRLKKAYDKTNQIAEEYNVPLAVEGDRRLAVASYDLKYNTENLLAS